MADIVESDCLHNDRNASVWDTRQNQHKTRRYKQIPALTPLELAEFWSLVDRRGADECWPWSGNVTTGKWGARYGIWNGFRPHRITYTLLVGPIPDGLTLDHIKSKCDIGGLCCNPAHTEPVTQSVNTLRHIQAKWATGVCKRGHPREPYTGACKPCAREYAREYRAIGPQKARHEAVEVVRPADSTTRTQEGAR